MILHPLDNYFTQLHNGLKRICGFGKRGYMKAHNIESSGRLSRHEPTPYESLTLCNSFIFGKVMQTHKELCLKLLQIILPDLNISEIKDAEIEKYLKDHYQTKGVRLDAYTRDGDGRHYDLEMQIADTKNLPKRARYYSSLMDTNALFKGEYQS